MGSGFSNPIIGGGGSLVYPSIHSPNFNQAAQTGWAINKDGSAFFFSIDAASTLTVHNAFGAVVMKVTANGFFQYFDHGSATQGGLILVIASQAGNDPVNGGHYGAGMTGIDPAFADFLNVIGATIKLGQLAYSSPGEVAAFTGSGSTGPYLLLNAPEQGVAGHLQMQMYGESPDGTVPSGLVIGVAIGSAQLTRQTMRQLEVQAADGNVYTAGHLTLITQGTYIVSGTGFTMIAPGTGPSLGVDVVAGTYKIDVLIFYTSGAAAGTPRFLIGGTATATAHLVSETNLTNSSTTDPAVSPAPTNWATAMNGIPMTLAGQVYVTKIRGSVVVTAAGTMQVQAATTVAGDDFTVGVGSEFDVFPN